MDLNKIRNPSNEKKVAPFWSWNDKLVEKELIRQIELMKEQGYGGFFMHSRVGLVTGYLSDKWMDLIKKCATKAKSLGMDAWLYDEDKWPSGYASGAVPLKKEEYREKGVVFIDSEELDIDDVIIKKFDLEGKTKYIALRVTKLGNQWFNNTTYIDTMNKEAVKAFLDSTHEKYKKQMGEFFGESIKGIFTDEPCTNMYCFYTVPFVPWSQNLKEVFCELKGYDITDRIEELFIDEGNYQKTRFDFYDSVSTMFIENFTMQYSKWCEENNLKLTGHFTSEENLIEQTCWMGSLMPNYEYLTIPGVDKLFNNLDQLVTLKQLTSVTEQLGKENALCECFAGIGHDSGFITRKWIADWQAVNGINFVNPHLSAYSMRGERKRDYPPNLFYQQPWWNDEKCFADYIARLCELVSSGKRSVRILILHPLTSAWCEFNPTQRSQGYPKVNDNYNKPFLDLAKILSDYRIDFHFGDETIIKKYAEVDSGHFIIEKFSYDTVIIPSCCNLRQTTYDILRKFRDNGGKIITLMDKPSRIDGELNSVELNENFHFKNVNELALQLHKDGYSEIEVTDTHTDTLSSKVISCVLDTNEGESIALIVNTDRKREIKAKIVVKREGIPLLVSMTDGTIFKIPYKQENGGIVINTTLISAGSLALYIVKKLPNEAQDFKEVMGIFKDGTVFDIRLENAFQKLDIKSVTVMDKNVLPLSELSLSANGEVIASKEHVSKISHFKYYPLNDGTEFVADYGFKVKKIPEGEVFAAIESAENLNEILINGVRVYPKRRKGEECIFNNKAWLDVSFTRVDLTSYLKEGDNQITIKGTKLNNIIGVGSHTGVKDFEAYAPTEVETIYIVGDFKVYSIDKEEFFIDNDINEVFGCDIVKSGYPFYAGGLNYEINVSLPNSKTILLKLSNFCGTSAKCYIDRKLVETVMFPPYVFNLSEFAGKNVDVEIITANDLYNLMGPAYLSELKTLPWVDIGVFNDASQYTKKLSLNPYGVEGAYLIFSN